MTFYIPVWVLWAVGFLVGVPIILCILFIALLVWLFSGTVDDELHF